MRLRNPFEGWSRLHVVAFVAALAQVCAGVLTLIAALARMQAGG